MASNNSIKEAIRGLSKTDDVIYSILCKVASVDTTNNTCDCEPIDESADLLDVRLMSQSSTGFLIIPKVDSIVVVTMMNKYTGYVSLYSEVEEIQLNGKNFKGLVKIEDLVTKINNLEDLVNNILTTLKATTIPLAPSGTYPFASLYTSLNTLITTQKSDLENTSVSHGDGN